MKSALPTRELSYCGLFGAAGLLLPVLFHVVHLGHIFMPMYFPLVTIAFFVRPLPAAVTGLIVPLLSGALTGMPPLYPPVALFMAFELAIMAALISFTTNRYPNVNEYLFLIPVLIFGRVLYVGLVYSFSLMIQLPAGIFAGLSFVRGWPGIILMIIVIPPIAKIRKILAMTMKEIHNG